MPKNDLQASWRHTMIQNALIYRAARKGALACAKNPECWGDWAILAREEASFFATMAMAARRESRQPHPHACHPTQAGYWIRSSWRTADTNHSEAL